MNSAERRMKLLILLQSRRKDLNVNYLSETFGVSRRTIFRDLKTLQNMEVPIAHDLSEGYSIPKEFTIPPMMFTNKEIATIMVGLSFVKSQVDKTMVDDAKSVEAKIRNIVPGALKTWMDALDSHIVVDPYAVNHIEKQEGGNWYQIVTGIVHRNVLRFTYAEGERKMSPYLLSYFTDHWTVIGFCHSRNDIRSFVLNKMQDIESGYEVYKPYNGQNEALIFRAEKKHDISVLIDRSVIDGFIRRLPAQITSIRDDSSGVIVTFSFDNLGFINSWLLQFGNKCKIMSPNQLRLFRDVYLKELLQDESYDTE